MELTPTLLATSRVIWGKLAYATNDNNLAYASYMKGDLLFEQDQNWDVALNSFKSAQELGKYGDVDNQVLGCERGEELESSIRYYCSHKIAGSNLQTSELVGIGGTEGPALDLFSAKLEVTPEF